jgi:hypothetical protein
MTACRKGFKSGHIETGSMQDPDADSMAAADRKIPD